MVQYHPGAVCCVSYVQREASTRYYFSPGSQSLGADSLTHTDPSVVRVSGLRRATVTLIAPYRSCVGGYQK